MKLTHQTACAHSLKLGDETVSFTLKRMRKNKHLRLHVSEDAEVIVCVPWRISMRESEEFVKTNSGWLLERLRITRSHLDMRRPLVDGIWLPLLDNQLRLRLHQAARNAVKHIDDELHVYSASHERPALVRLLELWYRRQAKSHMTERLPILGQHIGVRAASLTIRAQKTCWGSCSARGAISINWRLMLAPSCVLDYVLAHELCHLRHLNHSYEFWSLLEKVQPGYKNLRAQLRHLQAKLVL